MEEPPKNGESEAAHSKHESFDAGSYGFFGGVPPCHFLSCELQTVLGIYLSLLSMNLESTPNFS